MAIATEPPDLGPEVLPLLPVNKPVSPLYWDFASGVRRVAASGLNRLGHDSWHADDQRPPLCV
jgi:hypothetical protein